MDAENMFESNQDDKSSDGDQQQMAVAAAPIGEQKPDIFKLDVDCFGEVFDFLSLKDLHAFGQTCKRMQQVAGYYFRLTYHRANVRCLEDGIKCNDVQITGFSDFIENIWFCWSHLDHFRFVQSNEFKSLKKMSFYCISLTDEMIACIKKLLSKVEYIEIWSCDVTDNFHRQVFQYCLNMRCLSVGFTYEYVAVEYNWLIEHYPRLEQFVLNPVNDDRRIDELTTFFNRNSNVQHFATSVQILLVNQQSIMASNIKLDTLGILFEKELENDDIRKLLNEFYEQKIFKRLHLYICSGAEEDINRIDQTNCVEKLAYVELPMNVSSFPFVNLKELYSGFIPNDLNMDAVARALVNLELVCFRYSIPNEIFPFIRHSRKLKHIGIERVDKNEQKLFDLVLWNKERQKLIGARKVSIHVKEKFFLAIKKATQNREFSLIEIKRIDSLRLFFDFPIFFRTLN